MPAQMKLDKFLSLVPVEGFEENYRGDITGQTFFGFPF
jgi:hypothetical protein